MAKRPPKKAVEEMQPRYKVQAVVLSRFDTLQYLNNSSDRQRLALDCYITSVGHSEDADENGAPLYYGSVCFRCGREGDKEHTTIRMAALYSFAFSCATNSPEQVEIASRSAASTSVWSHFMGLFGLANAQMRSRMPLLPPDPGDMELRPLEELVDIFSAFGREEPLEPNSAK
jgi:hypothetical protein